MYVCRNVGSNCGFFYKTRKGIVSWWLFSFWFSTLYRDVHMLVFCTTLTWRVFELCVSTFRLVMCIVMFMWGLTKQCYRSVLSFRLHNRCCCVTVGRYIHRTSVMCICKTIISINWHVLVKCNVSRGLTYDVDILTKWIEQCAK